MNASGINLPVYRTVYKSQEGKEAVLRYFNLRPGNVPIYQDEELRILQMPLLLFAGEKDVLLNSKKTIDRIRNLLPHAKVNYLKDHGHVLIGFTKEILEFLLQDDGIHY